MRSGRARQIRAQPVREAAAAVGATMLLLFGAGAGTWLIVRMVEGF